MEAEDDIVRSLGAELKSYMPFILTTLLIYVVESNASLKLWHAVRQLPHLEKESTPDDCESNIDEAHAKKVRITRAAIKKEARKTRIERVVLPLTLVAIFMFDQFVTLSGWLNWSRKGEEFDGYVGTGAEGDFDGQSDYGYGWYYVTRFGQIDWAELYYPALLLLPAVIFLSKFINLISGFKEKVVFRDTQGAPFVLIKRGSRFVPRRPAFMCLSVILTSVSLSIGALWLRNFACVILLFASMAHYMVSTTHGAQPVIVRRFIISGLFMLALLLTLANALVSTPMSSDSSKLLRLFQSHDAGDVNWPGLIMGAMACNVAFQYIAMCYRMDHAFARPDELLVGKPDVKLQPRGPINPEGESLVDVCGTRISYFAPRSRWSKPYFHASLLSWLSSITFIALAKVQGYVECNGEMTNLFALYVSPPVISIGILICAVVRGELGKVWGHNEGWVDAPMSDCADGAAGAMAQVKAEEVLIEVDEKSSLPA